MRRAAKVLAEREDLHREQVGWARAYKHEQGVAVTEAARGRQLALRAAAPSAAGAEVCTCYGPQVSSLLSPCSLLLPCSLMCQVPH